MTGSEFIVYIGCPHRVTSVRVVEQSTLGMVDSYRQAKAVTATQPIASVSNWPL